MKKYRSLVILNAILVLCHFHAYAQNQVVGGVQAKGMDMNLYPYGTISQFGLPEKTTKGSTYLYEDWKLGTAALMKGGKIKDYPVRIDLANQTLEVNTNKGIRAVDIKQVDSITISNITSPGQLFVNAKKFNGAQVQIVGLVEVLNQGDLKLLKYYYIYVKEGAYNAALDIGNNEVKLLVRSKYYLFGNGLSTMMEIPKTKKKFLELIKDSDKEVVESFMSENKIGVKDEEELKAVANFLNEKKLILQ